MVTIAELGQAPGKSMRADEDMSSIYIDDRGLFGDREYTWVEGAPHTNVIHKPGKVVPAGKFLSQREDPELTSIIPALLPEGVQLSWGGKDVISIPRAEDVAANRIGVSVWDWEGFGVDQGNDAAAWGEAYIGRPARLVAVSDEAPRYVENDPSLGRVGFADAYPVTVGSLAAFKKINTYLESVGRCPIPTNRTRSTILLDGLSTPSEEAFPEDYIDTITIANNGLTLVLKRLKACGRCPIPDTDQLTGDRKTHVRSALGKLGRNGTHLDTNRYGTKSEIFLTQNFVLILPHDMQKGETIKVEQHVEVDVQYTDNTNWIPLGDKN